MKDNLPFTRMHEELGVIFAELRTVCERISSLLTFYENDAHPSDNTDNKADANHYPLQANEKEKEAKL